MVLFYCNEARRDGKAFWDKYESRISGGEYYVNSLRQDLLKVKNLPELLPSEKLYKSAEYHALDMGKAGMTGHDSSDGTSFNTRLTRMYGGWTFGENCSYGYLEPLDIVIGLLVDDGIPSLGHRKNLLNPKFNRVGIAIRDHKTYGNNCVQDFGGE